jgi:heat shock protein HslJ
VSATVLDRICRDTMTGLPRPNTVEVNMDGRVLNGCGGDPGVLLQGVTWIVQSIGGSPVVPKSRATVTFGADGMVSGSSSCNSYRGPYTITGEGLTIGQTAGTLMACLPELMTQETAFLGLLRDIRHFDLRPDGTLELKTADGRTIVASRDKPAGA